MNNDQFFNAIHPLINFSIMKTDLMVFFQGIIYLKKDGENFINLDDKKVMEYIEFHYLLRET